MKAINSLSFSGPLEQLIYSPKGEIEGVLIKRDGELVQLCVDKNDDETAVLLSHLTVGQSLSVEASAQKSPRKGGSQHPVHEGLRLVTVDGKPPAVLGDDSDAAYIGRVASINFARHGEPNGVVLDTGDFIHLKPEGMVKLKLRVGDEVRANGDAHRTVDDKGWAVEAVEVNGKVLASR